MKLITTQQSLLIAGGYYDCQPNDYKCLTTSYSLVGVVGGAVAGVALTSAFRLPALVCLVTGLAGIKVGAIVGYAFGVAAYEVNMKATSILEGTVNSLVGDVFTPPTVYV
jgi:hypothetical protein